MGRDLPPAVATGPPPYKARPYRRARPIRYNAVITATSSEQYASRFTFHASRITEAPLSFPDPRTQYTRHGLHESDLDPDPLVQFRRWLDEAVAADLIEPYAMTLATATPDGRP